MIITWRSLEKIWYLDQSWYYATKSLIQWLSRVSRIIHLTTERNFTEHRDLDSQTENQRWYEDHVNDRDSVSRTVKNLSNDPNFGPTVMQIFKGKAVVNEQWQKIYKCSVWQNQSCNGSKGEEYWQISILRQSHNISRSTNCRNIKKRKKLASFNEKKF